MKYKNGSALLVVLAMIVVMSAALMHAWFMASGLHDVMRERERMYKAFYATDAVMGVAMGIVARSYDRMSAALVTHKRIDLPTLSSLVNNREEERGAAHKSAGAFMYAMTDNNLKGIVVSAWYRDQVNTHAYRITCLLTKKEILRDGQKHARIIISHYTFGTGV